MPKFFWMRRIPKLDNKKSMKSILLLFFLSLLAFVLVNALPSKRTRDLLADMLQGSRIMKTAVETVSLCRDERNLSIDTTRDINRTGLIGLERSIITTTKGSLEAKRTSLDPNFAGLFVYLLHQAGVRRQDTVAAGASGSFPGSILALLSAARAMDLRVIMICSIGASQWGSNDPDFHWLDVLACLQQKGIFQEPPVAFSLGGEKDTGDDMDPLGRRLLTERLSRMNASFIQEAGLMENVSFRMRLYQGVAGGEDIEAFVNIGGSWANMGEDSSILDLKPGLTRVKDFPSREKQGVIHAMAANDIPIIHCLFIRGLAEKYGFEWDPSPLPQPGEGRLYGLVRDRQPLFLCITGVYIFCVFMVLFIRLKSFGL